MKKTIKSGTGRFGWLTMRPMSLWESGESTGEISLSDLFLSPDKIGALNKLTLPMLAFTICRGGWPRSLQKKSKKAALQQVTQYYKAITNTDISKVDNVKKRRAAQKRESCARTLDIKTHRQVLQQFFLIYQQMKRKKLVMRQ